MPVNPVSVPITRANSTGAQITELRYDFDTASALFNKYNRTDKALRQILLSTVDEMFIRSLWPHHHLCHPVSLVCNLHQYLLADLQENNAVICTPYNVNQPIESLFVRVENCGEYAAVGNNPYSLEQVIGNAFQLVYHTGLFVDN